jgi:hypothetical protein
MFKTFEEIPRFGEDGRHPLFKSGARWSAAAVIAALWIQVLLFDLLAVE